MMAERRVDGGVRVGDVYFEVVWKWSGRGVDSMGRSFGSGGSQAPYPAGADAMPHTRVAAAALEGEAGAGLERAGAGLPQNQGRPASCVAGLQLSWYQRRRNTPMQGVGGVCYPPPRC